MVRKVEFKTVQVSAPTISVRCCRALLPNNVVDHCDRGRPLRSHCRDFSSSPECVVNRRATSP